MPLISKVDATSARLHCGAMHSQETNWSRMAPEPAVPSRKKICSTLTALGAALSLALPASAAFYGDAPDEHHPWAVHDENRPQPKVVTPGQFSTPAQPGQPPSDALVLFDGTDFSKWESAKDGSAVKWILKDGFMEATKTGDIRTKDQFGDCQLHIEWAAPSQVEGQGQGRGNSGIFLMGRLEIQVLDSYRNTTYADGHAASVYGVNPPMVNALRPPGQFQVYDIVFRRPIYKENKLVDPGYVTVFVNGVLAQDHTPLEGPTGHMGRSKPAPFPEKGPIQLQDHSNPTRFRNIWIRELPPRSIEGGTDGYLTTEATLAKRQEIAAGIRQSAAEMKSTDHPLPKLRRLMESLVYEKDEATYDQVEKMAARYANSLQQLPAEKLAAKKDEVLGMRNAFNYLAKFKVVPESFEPRTVLEQIVKDQGWDKRRRN